MKRSVILLCVLAALSAICVAAAHFRLMGTADKVEFRETVYAGDIAATEGLTLRTRQSLNKQLYWDSVLPVDAPELARTEFTALTKKQEELADWFNWPTGLQMYFGDAGTYHNYNSGGAFDEDKLSEHLTGETEQMFEDFILAVSKRTPAGDGRTETVRAREVSKYVPISAYLELYGFGETVVLSEEFAEIFRFPMPEEATFTVWLEKNAFGQIEKLDTSLALTQDPMQRYNADVQVYSTVTEDKCFFAVRGTGLGPLDFSDVTLGYGLYCLSWSAEDDSRSGDGLIWAEVRTGAPHTVLPLSENDTVYELLDAEDGTLLLVLKNQKGLELVVIDAETERTVQRFTLFTPDELGEENWWSCKPLGDKLYAGSERRVRFYERGADGRYALLLDAPNDAKFPLSPDMDPCRYSTPAAVAWDGERLATIVSCADTGYLIDDDTVGGGLLLMVYDASGLRYCGCIQSGAMDGEQGSYSDDAVVWGKYSLGSSREPGYTLSFSS